MAVQAAVTETRNLEIRVADANGNVNTAVYASCSIRSGRGFNCNVEISNAELAAANLEECKQQVSNFIREQAAVALAGGIPIDI